jgi:hypothetical protein
LEKAHLANLLGTDARGSDVGHGPASEFNPGVSGIDPISQNWNTDGMNTGNIYLFAYQPLHDVQIVNHQVEHHVDVQRPGRELADAMDFEVNGVIDEGPQSYEGRTESFGMTHLQYSGAFLSRRDHLISLGQSSGNWLFDQDMDTGFQQTAGDFAVRLSRHGQTDGIYFAAQGTPIRDRFSLAFRGNLPGSGLVNIANKGKPGTSFRG